MVKYQIKLKKGSKTNVVKFEKNDTFEVNDKISVLEQALGNVKLKEAYSRNNKKTFILNSDKTFSECLGAKNAELFVEELREYKKSSLITFVAE